MHTAQVSGKFAGKPDKFLELEKDLVGELTQGIQAVLGEGPESSSLEEGTEAYFAARQKTIKKRDAYVKGKFLSAEALELEDAGKFAEAMEVWQQVLDLDPQNEVAGVRLEVLATMPMN